MKLYIYKQQNVYVIPVCSNEFTWIGCNDLIHEGKFVWSHNNQAVSYFKWHPGQPDNQYNEDCCSLAENGYWNDFPCHRSLESFICKK